MVFAFVFLKLKEKKIQLPLKSHFFFMQYVEKELAAFIQAQVWPGKRPVLWARSALLPPDRGQGTHCNKQETWLSWPPGRESPGATTDPHSCRTGWGSGPTGSAGVRMRRLNRSHQVTPPVLRALSPR